MNRKLACLLSILVLGSALRLVGITRGSDGPLSGSDFHTFHPDEATLVRSALALSSPTEPPLTAYGLLPLYLARLALVVTEAGTSSEGFGESFAAILTVRVLAIAISCGSLWLVYVIGRRCYDEVTACLGTFFVAVAPLAVQQAHFYTVDGLFTLCALSVVLATLNLGESPSPRRYLVAGILVGLATSVRLNGLLLGGVIAAIHVLAQRGADWPGWRAVALQPRPWLSAGAAIVTVLILQPYLLLSPGLLGRDRVTDDFGLSAKVASGEILRLWSLVDVHTLPYLHFLTDLLPWSVGWPLAVAMLLGVGAALWQRQQGPLLLAGWSITYFGFVGWLHTKHVRYLWPMLPFMAIVTAGWSMSLCRTHNYRRAISSALVALLLYCGWYGVAFARIYTIDDSRMQAGEWIRTNLPAGSVVGLERGAFTLAPLIDGQRFQKQFLGLPIPFGSRGYLTCEATHAFLYEIARHVDYIALVDVNRYRQFVAVPDLFPAVAGFYRELTNENLGFKRLQRFKTYPSFAGLSRRDDDAETSFVAYDHPAVSIYQRDRGMEAAWESWKVRLLADEGCVDRAAGEVAQAIEENDPARAAVLLATIRKDYPEVGFTGFIEADLASQAGSTATAQQRTPGQELYLSGFADQSRAGYLIPWATGHSLLHLGLPDLALKALIMGTMLPFEPVDRLPMARAYLTLANKIRDLPRHAEKVYELSTRLHPLPGACNRLGVISISQGRVSEALIWWRRSIELDPQQAKVHADLARLLVRHDLDPLQAVFHADMAGQLDPALEVGMADLRAAAESQPQQ